jgi:hypothetical protein
LYAPKGPPSSIWHRKGCVVDLRAKVTFGPAANI